MIIFILMLILVFAPIARGSVNPLAFCVIQALTLLMLSIWFFKMFKHKEIRLKRTPLDIPVLLLVILGIASIFKSVYRYDTLIEFLKLLNIISIFYLVINNIDDRKDIERLVNLIVILAAALSLFGIIQYVGAITNSWWSEKRFLSSVYVNHNHFAGLLELSIPLCLGVMLTHQRIEKRLFYAYLIILMLTAFIFSMSRGAWFSLSISMIVMMILLYKERLIGPWLFITLLIIAVGGFFLMKGINLRLFLSRIASYRDLDLSGRIEIWKGTLRMIKEHPFLGTGLGTFIYYFPRYRPVGLNMFINYAHNDYLQVLAEMGIAGFICMVYIIFSIIRKGFTTYIISHSYFKKSMTIGVTIGILSIAIHSMADFNLNIPANVALFSVLAGLTFNLRSRNEEKEIYLKLNLNNMSLQLLRPVFTIAIFVWVLFIARVFIAEAICIGIKELDFNARTRVLNNAINLMPEKNKYYKELAQLYMDRSVINLDREKDLMMALEGYGRAAEINPMDAWAWLGKADALLYLGLLKEAEYAYKRALALDPNNSYYLKRYGNVLAAKGDVTGSINIFKGSNMLEEKRMSKVTISYDAARPELYMEKGDVYYKEGDLEKAVNMYRIAEGLTPENENIKIKIMDILERMGKHEEIARYLSSMPLDNAAKTLLLNSRARYLMSKGKYSQVDMLIDKALNINSEDIRSLQNKIDILQRQKKPFDIVRPYMERLVKLNRDATQVTFSGKGVILIFDLGKAGIMAQAGLKEIPFVLPLGIVDIKIFASGTFAKGEWPHMLIKMNSKNILSEYVKSSSLIEFDARGVVGEYYNKIQIEFSNDYWDSLTKEDRNLDIEKVVLEYIYPYDED